MSWGLTAVAAATIGTGVLQSQAIGDAANIQADAAKTGVAETARQFNITQEQLAPFREAGMTALDKQLLLLGLTGTPEDQQQAFAAFSDSPGQQFLRDQQEKALLRSASATGNLGGGNVKTALQAQAFGRAQTDFQAHLDRLSGISGTGHTATTNVGQFGAQAAGNIANLQAAGGAARASGILGQQQVLGQTVSSLSGLAAQGGLLPTAPAATPSVPTTPNLTAV